MERYKKEFKEESIKTIKIDVPMNFVYHIENILMEMKSIDTISAFNIIIKSLDNSTKEAMLKKLVNNIIMQTNLKEYFV